LREHASRLSDPSLSAAQAELDRLRTTLGAVEALDAPHSRDAQLDLDAVVRVSKHYARWYERDADASNLELAALPNGAVQHALLHIEDHEHVEALAERTEAVPQFLALHGENLLRGARDHRAPDHAVVLAFATRVLPGAASAMAAVATHAVARAGGAGFTLSPALVGRLERASRRAHEAYVSFGAMVSNELAPAARESVVLGEEESTFRLHATMGLEDSIDDLLALAKSELDRAHASLSREAVLAALEPKPASVAAAVALYERHLAAATTFISERALVPMPASLALALEPLPPGIADGGALTNWPAPLLDPKGRGHALHSAAVGDHPIVQTKNLAVHEGIPGHYLQSAWWQESASSPVRFLGVTDDVAMSRSYFGTMLSVEGWAVHMEQLLFAEGFYEDGPEHVFFAWCDCIRAMRVLLDLGLHARGLTEEEALRLVMHATFMPEGWARAQILRSKRMPLQSLTYLVGANEIAKLRSGAGRSLDALSFHRLLLSAGPVPPSRLAASFGGS
jgi:uncharacterized protein (DUF885 family)